MIAFAADGHTPFDTPIRLRFDIITPSMLMPLRHYAFDATQAASRH